MWRVDVASGGRVEDEKVDVDGAGRGGPYTVYMGPRKFVVSFSWRP
jgi:hypothetical protein